MTRKTLVGVGMMLAVIAISAFVCLDAMAQPKAAAPAGKEVTLMGKVLDLQCFMAGTPAAEKDPAKCAEKCIKDGVPAILETKEGVVFLGMVKGGPEKFAPLAGQEVEVKGKLFEKHGIKYVEVESIAKKAAEKKEEANNKEAKKPEAKKAEEKKPEPAKKEEPAKKPEPKTK